VPVRRRQACFALGLLTLAAVWLGPLPQLARQAFAAHMTMHMGVVAVAAPVLALAIAGARLDPVRRAPALFAPIVASLVELLVVWGWHAPALHRLARHAPGGLVVEQGMFLLAGLLVWLSAVGGDARQRAGRAGGGIVALLLTSMHMTLLGSLIAMSPRPLYSHAARASTDNVALREQHRGGAIMLVIGGASYLAGGLWLSARLLGRPTVNASR
jgi:putative membrane protein